MKKRITYFDLAKGIGIILVVLGHMENISGELRTWISSFHMPLFFVISGMLIAAKNEVKVCGKDFSNTKNELNTQIIKAAKGLLIPYFWFSLIYIPIDIMNLYIENVDMHTFVQNILDSATFAGVSVMWFLPALLIAEIVAMIVICKLPELLSSLLKKENKSYEENEVVIYIAILVLSLFISITSHGIWNKIRPVYDNNLGSYAITTSLGLIRTILRGMAMNVHVVAGYIMYNLISFVEEKYIKKKVNGLDLSASNAKELEATAAKSFRGLGLALGVILFVLNMGFCLKNGAVDNHFLTLNKLTLYYLCAFLGSMAIILICKGLDTIPFIEFLGKNSLIIMATHLQCYLLYAGILIAIAIDTHVTRAKSYIYMFNSVLFTMLFEVIVILVINKFFPFIVGKGSIKNLFKKSQN